MQLDPEQDFTITVANALIWTGVEVDTAIICGQCQTSNDLTRGKEPRVNANA